jgi:hypothetical protein
MKTKYTLLLLLTALSVIVRAQEPGYFGRKTLIEFGAQGQLPVFQNLVTNEKGYVYRSGELHRSYNLKDFSFRGSIGVIVTENAAMALEYSHHFYQVNPLRGGELNRQYTDTGGALIAQYIRPEVAFLDIQERVIMPKVIYSSFDGRVPAGLSQEIGIGYCMIGITNREPQTAFDGTPDAETIRKQLIDPEVDELKGMTFLYGLRMNFPVTRSFLINVGVRYNYSWLFSKKDYRKMEQTESWLSGREIWSRVNQRRQLGIITFGVGGTIVL